MQKNQNDVEIEKRGAEMYSSSLKLHIFNHFITKFRTA